MSQNHNHTTHSETEMKPIDLNNQELRHNPFKVPEGYFDQLTARIMEQLPEQETAPVVELKPRKSMRWMGWAAAAAACITLAIMFPKLTEPATVSPETEVTAHIEDEEQYEQDVLEYAMVDNTDVYAYLAGH